MSEKEAWEKIRDAFKAYAETGVEIYMTYIGICFALDTIFESDEISSDVFHKMRRRMIKPANVQKGSLWWPINRKGARKRVKFIEEILKTL